MQIFVDESGIFTVPPTKQPSISCVSALVIPDDIYDKICNDFKALKATWGFALTKVKGKLLDEPQVFEVIQMLINRDILLEITAIEMSSQTNDAITRHKLAQAEKMIENLTPRHKPSFVKSLKDVQTKLKDTTNQLYTQAVVSFDLICNVLQNSVLYYVQRKPQELGHFRWVIDAKDKKLTPYEALWSKLLLPMHQSHFLREPLIMLRGADYSHFERFCHVADAPPAHLRQVVGDVRPFEYIDTNAIMKDLSFLTSDQDLGLQLVDILCNAAQRAMNGKLKFLGWRNIGFLTVQAQKGNQEVHLVDLTGKTSRTMSGRDVPYGSFVLHVERTAKPMLRKDIEEIIKR